MSDERIVAELILDDGKYTVRMNGASRAAKQFEKDIRRLDKAMTKTAKGTKASSSSLLKWTVIIGQSRNALHQLWFVTGQWTQSLIKTSAEVERLTFLMKGMSDASSSAEKLKEAKDNVQALFDVAKNAPFSMNALSDSFVKFKSVGLDPLDGSMGALVDAVAAFGGTDEVLGRASIAIQQMAGKGVISMEELRQQLGEAVPQAITIMAQSMGVSYGELVDQISKGTVAAKPALEAMFNGMKMVYGGRAQSMMDTYNGRVAKMKTAWTELVANNSGIKSFFESQKTLITAVTDALNSDAMASFAKGLGDMLTSVVGSLSTMIESFSLTYGHVRAFIGVFNNATMDSGSFISEIMSALQATIGLLIEAGKQFGSLVKSVTAWSRGMTETEYDDALFAERVKNGADFAEDEYDDLLEMMDQKTYLMEVKQKEFRDSIVNLREGLESTAGEMAIRGEKLVTLSQFEDAAVQFNNTRAILDKAYSDLKFKEQRFLESKREVELLTIDGSPEQKNRSEAVFKAADSAYSDAQTSVFSLEQDLANLTRSLALTAQAYGYTADELKNNLQPTIDEFGDKVPLTDQQIRDLASSTDTWASNAAGEIVKLGLEIEKISDTKVDLADIIDSEFTDQVDEVLSGGLDLIDDFQENIGTAASEMRSQVDEIMNSSAGSHESRFAQATEIVNGFYETQASNLTTLAAAAQEEMRLQGEAGIAAAISMGSVVSQIISSFSTLSAGYLKGLENGVVSVAGTGKKAKGGKSDSEKAMEKLTKMMDVANRKAESLATKFADPFGYQLPAAIDKAKAKIDGLADKMSGGKWTSEMQKLFDTIATNEATKELIDMAEATRDIERALMGERGSREATYKDEVQRIKEMKAKLIEMGIWRVEWEKTIQDQLLALEEQHASESPLGDYMNEWKNLYDDLESAGVDTLKSLSQGFADFVTEGEADFEGLARSAVNSLLQISANAALSGLVSWGQEAASGFFNKTPVTAGVSHSGDIVGSASRTRSVNMEMFSNAPRYHTGGVIGQEVPAILEKGEGVFTAEQMKALGAGQSKQSGTTKVNIINNSGTDVDSEETNTRMDMDGIVMDIVLKKINQPGPYRDNMKRALG